MPSKIMDITGGSLHFALVCCGKVSWVERACQSLSRNGAILSNLRLMVAPENNPCLIGTRKNIKIKAFRNWRYIYFGVPKMKI